MPKTLRVGVLSPTRSLNATAPDHETALVLHQVLETPFAPVPGKAELEPVLFAGPLERSGSDERPVYRGRVREGLRFSDGLPLAAHHVAAALRHSRVIREQALLSVEEPWLTFTLKVPNGRFDLSLAHLQCGVSRPHGTAVLGTGPFAVAPDSRPERIHLVRNPHARRRTVLDEVVFETFPPDRDGQPTALYAALEGGQVDVTLVQPRGGAAGAQGWRQTVLPGPSTGSLFLNTQSPRLRDAAVRQALAQAVDRQALAADAYHNPLAFTATSLLPRGLAVAPVRDGLSHDPQRARAQLAAAGAAAPRRLSLLVTWAPRPYLPRPRQTAELLRSQLSGFGIELELVHTHSLDEFLKAEAAGRCDLLLGGWMAETPDPSDYLESHLSSARIPGESSHEDSANAGRLRSPEMARALADYRAGRRHEQLAAIMGLLTKQAPLVPLMYGATTFVHALRVTGLRPSALALLDLATADLLGKG